MNGPLVPRQPFSVTVLEGSSGFVSGSLASGLFEVQVGIRTLGSPSGGNSERSISWDPQLLSQTLGRSLDRSRNIQRKAKQPTVRPTLVT